MKRIFFVIACTLMMVYAHAQIESPIITDRPDQTESPFLVYPWHVQLESGVQQSGEQDTRTMDLPTLLARIGITEFAELRLGGTNSVHYTNDISPEEGVWSRNLFAGMKTQIYSGKEGITQIGFIGHIGIEMQTWNLFSEVNSALTPYFRFCIQHSLTDNYALSYNAGCQWEPFSFTPSYIYTLSNAYAFTDKLGAFLEVYGQFSEAEYLNEHSLDGGLTFLLQPNMQLDISGGLGMNSYAPDWFLSAGYSVRLPN